MKNLKRVLSMGLASVMLVGMMAVGTSAVNAKDFTDADEIQNTEAVSIATALSIIDGKEDGSFDPKGNVTRGQMAKMITRAMFGGDDPVLGVKTTPTFSDIKGRWDESYIEYCASNNIINGRGDGTFDPEGNVTGTEAAKMLLTALGYRADIYGLVGADWALTTNSIANRTDVNLYGNLKGLDPNVAFTRDQVSQMIYNALNAETMEMKPGMEITNGNVTYNYEPSGKTLLFDKYGAVRVEGVVTANEFTNNADSQKGKTRIEITNADELKEMLGTVKANPNIDTATGKDEFGKAVYFYVKPSSSVKSDLSKGTLISDVILDEANTVITITKAFPEGSKTKTKTVKDWLDANGLEISAGGDDKPAVPTYLKNYATAGAPTASSTNVAGTEFVAIDNNDDGYVDYVLQNTYAFGQVTKYNTKDKGAVTVRTKGDSSLVPTNAELANVVAYEDIAVDDYVNVTLVGDTYYISAAEVVEGELDAFKADKNVSVDGETYDFSAQTEYTGTKLRTEIADNNVLGETVTIYLDNFGYFVCGTTEAATDYLFVANVSWNNVASSLISGTANAFVYFEDGTSGSYVINKIDDSKATEATAEATLGKVYKYSVTSDGKLNLTDANGVAGATSKSVEYKKGQSTLKVEDAADTLVTTSTVVFVVTLDSDASGNPLKTIDKVNVYNSKTAPSMDYTTDASNQVVASGEFYPGIITVANADDAKKNDVVVFVNNKTAVTGNWLYLINYIRTTSDGAEFNAIVDGEVVKIVTNDKSDRTKKGAYEYEMDDELYAIGSAYVNVASGFVTYADDTSIIVDDEEYNITKDTVTALLDDGDTQMDVSIEEKSTVVVLFNNSTDMDAEGIFILSEAADGNSEVEGYSSFVTWNDTDSQYELTASEFDLDADNKIETVADLKKQFTISDGAKAMWLAAAPADGAAVDTIEAETESAAITAGTYYLVVISKGVQGTEFVDGYTVYKVVIK